MSYRLVHFPARDYTGLSNADYCRITEEFSEQQPKRSDVEQYLLGDLLGDRQFALLNPAGHLSGEQRVELALRSAAAENTSILTKIGIGYALVSAGDTATGVWEQIRCFKNKAELHNSYLGISIKATLQSDALLEHIELEFRIPRDTLERLSAGDICSDRINLARIARGWSVPLAAEAAQLIADMNGIPVLYAAPAGPQLLSPRSSKIDLESADFRELLQAGDALRAGQRFLDKLPEVASGEIDQVLQWLVDVEKRMNAGDISIPRDEILRRFAEHGVAPQQAERLDFSDDRNSTDLYFDIVQHLLAVIKSDGVPHGAGLYVERYRAQHGFEE